MAMNLLFPLALAITFSTKFEGGSLGPVPIWFLGK